MIPIRGHASSDYQSLQSILQENSLYDADLDNAENLQKKIGINPRSILLAEAKGKVVGCVYTVYDGWQAFIFRLAVKRDYQRQGIGTALLKEAENSLRVHGAKHVALWIREEEIPHLADYYKKHGYIPSSRRHQCMWKAL